MLKKRRISIDVSIGSIFWVLFALGIVYLVSQLLDVVILIFCAILITLAVCPLVDRLERRKINRTISTLIILFTVFGILVYATVTLATPLLGQTELFLQRLPVLVDAVSPIKFDSSSFYPQLSSVPNQVFKIAVGTFSGFITTFAVIVLSFYMIQEMHNLRNYFHFWFGAKGERYYQIAQKLEVQIGLWIRGQLSLMLIVGALSYLSYLIIGLPFSIALGVIAGVLELVPNIGPTIATIPAVLVGFSVSPTHGIAALVAAILIQQLENNLIVPKVMQKAVGLNPIVTLVALMVGLRLGGPLLAVLALPAVLTARVILSHIKLNKVTNIPEIK